MPVTPGQTIHKGAFDNWRYCYACKFYKPPIAHHCKCVLIGPAPSVCNGVGKAALRAFALTLHSSHTSSHFPNCRLQRVQLLRGRHGPPLPVHQQLRGESQPARVHSVPRVGGGCRLLRCRPRVRGAVRPTGVCACRGVPADRIPLI
jgi:hypothetical protein